MTDQGHPLIVTLPAGSSPAWQEGAFRSTPTNSRLEHDDPPDAMPAPTRADGRRHWVARLALLDHLIVDTRVVAVFFDWIEQNSVYPSIEAFRQAMDSYAQRAGLPDRRSGWTEEGLRRIREFEASAGGAELRRHTREFRNAKRKFFAAVDNGSSELARKELELLRDHFDLPWPWLVRDLAWGGLTILVSYMLGRQVVVAINLPGAEPLAPLISVRLMTRRGETVSQLRERVEDQLRQLRTLLRPASGTSLADTEGAKSDETARRQVEWFYRHRLARESIRSIARTDLFDRATVRYGIRQAEHMLAVAYQDQRGVGSVA